jgi:hypothetical protein
MTMRNRRLALAALRQAEIDRLWPVARVAGLKAE